MILSTSRELQSFFATTARELEPLLARELEELGATEVKPKRFGVEFKGTMETAYRACLWSRTANRILLPIKSFAAPTPEKLYAGVKSIRWSEHLTPSNTLAVDFTSSTGSDLTHTHYGALKAKDAIVDQLRSVLGARPSVELVNPDLRINIYVVQNEATVSIDLSGDSLHRRGYRTEAGAAPLKENLAAGMLLLANWPEVAKNGGAFLDPMCGSGTLAIEAAMIACDVAPGLLREHFGFSGWLGHVPAVWKRVREEAEARREKGLAARSLSIVGTDEDFRVVTVALANLERAGLRGKVHFEKRPLAQAEAPKSFAKSGALGVLMSNPPYGERMSDVEELVPLYKLIGDTMKNKFQGWEGYVLTSAPQLAKAVRLSPARKFVLFNGALECRMMKYELFSGSGRERV